MKSGGATSWCFVVQVERRGRPEHGEDEVTGNEDDDDDVHLDSANEDDDDEHQVRGEDVAGQRPRWT